MRSLLPYLLFCATASPAVASPFLGGRLVDKPQLSFELGYPQIAVSGQFRLKGFEFDPHLTFQYIDTRQQPSFTINPGAGARIQLYTSDLVLVAFRMEVGVLINLNNIPSIGVELISPGVGITIVAHPIVDVDLGFQVRDYLYITGEELSGRLFLDMRAGFEVMATKHLTIGLALNAGPDLYISRDQPLEVRGLVNTGFTFSFPL